MITLTTRVRVDGLTAGEVFEFLANPDDDSYRAWWPGTHLAFHTLARHDGHVGDVVYMDEYVGRRRLRMEGLVTEAIPGRRLTWQLRKGITLPARLCLDLEDSADGVSITHTTRVGFGGAGRLLDPFARMWLSQRFASDLDQHVRTEFPRLRDLVRERGSRAALSSR